MTLVRDNLKLSLGVNEKQLTKLNTCCTLIIKKYSAFIHAGHEINLKLFIL